MSRSIPNFSKKNNMLRGTLYELVRADSLGATVRLLPESAVYRGHFPGYPITPGVCLVQIALELIAGMAGPVRLVAAKNIKFTSPVIPKEGLELRFDLTGAGENWSVEIHEGDVLSAKMSLTVA